MPTPPVTVRAATEVDLAAVKAIYDTEVLGGVATFAVTPPGLERWREQLASRSRGDHVLVAEATDRRGVVGYACSGPYRPREAYARTRETSLYLAEGARGLGVGRLLYDALLDRLIAAEGYIVTPQGVFQPWEIRANEAGWQHANFERTAA